MSNQPTNSPATASPNRMRRALGTVRQIFHGKRAAAAMVQTLAVRVFILGINLVTGVVTARNLGPDGRGELAAIMLWPQLLSYLLTLGLPASIIFNLKRYPKQRNYFFIASLLLSLGLGAIATIVGVIGLPYWLSQYSSETIYQARVLVVLAPISLLSLVMVAFCEVEGDFTVSNQSKYLLPVFTLIALLILMGCHQIHPITAALAYMLPSIAITGWLVRRITPYFQPLVFRWARIRKSGYRLFFYGLQCYGIDLLTTLSNRLLGQALVIGLLNPAAMGLYAVAFSISRMLNLFEQAVISVLVAKTSARPIPDIVKLTGCAARVTTTLTVLCVIPLTILCPILLKFLYGDQFLGAVPVFRWLLLEVTLGGTTWVLSQAFMAAGKPSMVTLFQTFGVGLSIPLLLILVPKYGLVGVGYALLISTTVRFLLVLISYPRVLKQPIPSLLICIEDVRFMRKQLA
ncbi:MAG: oligosaccharide flippase family protein [Leptolyngbyaceae bacterium]|nr:oligosaccharide flippase family protein [Leptolyngbyaceae bacterium]